MNQREKILMIAVLSMGALFGGKKALTSYFDALHGLDADIVKEQDKLEDLEALVRKDDQGVKTWKDLARKTLSTEEGEVKNILRLELQSAVTRVGLYQAEVRPSASAATWGKTRGMKVYYDVVSGLATIEQIVRFLHDLETQPFLNRVTSLSIKPSRKTELPGMMGFEMRVETPIFLETERVPVSKLEPTPLAPIESRQRETGRLQLASVDEYLKSFTQELFEPYKLPLPDKVALASPADSSEFLESSPASLAWQAAKGATSYKIYVADSRRPSNSDAKPLARPEDLTWRLTQAEKTPGKTYYWRVDAINESGTTTGDVWKYAIKGETPTGTTVIAPPPARPPADQDLVLGRIWSGETGQIIVLENTKNRTAPDVRKSIGDDVYGGFLIFVHPKGAVTENETRGRLFHKKGEPLKNGKPLTEMDQPVIFDALQKLERKLEGISQRSGVTPPTTMAVK